MINLLPLKLRLWIEQRYVERLTSTGHGERKLGQFSGATVVDHQLWDQVLKAHLTENVTIGDVTGVSTVDYAGVASDGRFDQYLAQLAAVDLDKIPPAEELALYINAYNALTVGLIVAHERRGGPALASINELSTPAAKVWDVPAGQVGGEQLSLGEIEHHKLRARWNEPALHACIVCASASCPNLRREAFCAARLREQMDEQVATWFANPTKGLAWDAGQLTLSRILLWFSKDFGGRQAAADFALRALGTSHAAELRKRSSFATRYFEYSWPINRTPT